MPPTHAESYIAAVVTLLIILIVVACFFGFAWTPWCGGAGSCGSGGLRQSCGAAPESDKNELMLSMSDFLKKRRHVTPFSYGVGDFTLSASVLGKYNSYPKDALF